MKKRPSPWWFGVGGLLLVLGVVIGGVLIATTVGGATKTDGVFVADGEAHTVDAPAGETRMLFAPQGSPVPTCTLTDGGGDRLSLRGVFGTSMVSTGGRTWVAFGTVDSAGDGTVSATCTASEAVEVRMGAPLTVSGLGGRILLAFAAFFGLGGAGFIVLLVTTILWVTRKPQAGAQQV